MYEERTLATTHKFALSLNAALLYKILRASIEVQEYRSTVRILGDDECQRERRGKGEISREKRGKGHKYQRRKEEGSIRENIL